MYFVVLVFDIAGIAITSSIGGTGKFLDVSHRIAAAETLYRIGLLCGFVGSLTTVLLAVSLYVALRPVDGNLALSGLLFRVVEAAIGGVGAIGAFATLPLYLMANGSKSFDTNQLAGLVALTTSNAGTYVDAIFFCVGSTIFFYLFLRSAYIPRIVAAWGLFASVVYMLAFVVSLIFPPAATISIIIGSIPILIAELSTGGWLLLRGIRTA